jgi:hypothetical protein
MRHNLFFAFLVFPALVFAQGNSRGAASLKLPTTPFVGSTGESFVADPKSLSSLLVNPSNIAASGIYCILFSHTEWIQDVRTEFLSFSTPFKYGYLALSIGNTSVDGLEVRSVPGPPIGTFNTQSTFFQLTYAAEITENIKIGIAPKYLYEKIFVDDATGWSIDIGTLYTPSLDGVTIGFSLTDLGSLAAFRNDRTDLPSQARLGGTYLISTGEMTFRAAAALSSELGVSANHLSLGAEVNYDDAVTIRLGYKTGYAYRGFSAGIGLRYSLANIDYAFIPSSSQMGDAHIISIGFNF